MTHILLYIDPGSGSFIFQLLIAGGLAVGFYFKKIRDTLMGWFRSVFSSHSRQD
ncbi:MAG: hypothetical protein R3C61_19955 [Bacteroidia bacterium]